MPLLLPNKNEKTKEGSRVLDITAKTYQTEEATATEVEAAEVPVEDQNVKSETPILVS